MIIKLDGWVDEWMALIDDVGVWALKERGEKKNKMFYERGSSENWKRKVEGRGREGGGRGEVK